ncbi:neuropeptides capa receptor [Caerostris extrusa]|uniref:Neuropeptides capa receptor n=1 Tax=Caerostris extrusa TaxID=172846 RepID=A0AAV4VKG4_CAEEX|nr:neuropeptides capa receptor [Caerostris extrusa]
MPLELYSLWQQYPWQLGSLTCILRSVVSEASAYASILTIMKFSCDQYYAVCHPLHHKTQSKIKRAFRNIAIIWLISFMAAAPYGYFTKVNYITLEGSIKLKRGRCNKEETQKTYRKRSKTKKDNGKLEDGEELMESAWCGFPFNDPNKHWETLMLCSTILFFVVPMVLMTVLYSRISITLYRARNQFGIETAGEERNDAHRARIRSRMAAIKMLC